MRTAIPLTFAACVVGALVTSACSTTPPAPPAYDAPDLVGTDVDPADLVGIWTAQAINPYPDQPAYISTIEYRNDGTVVGQVEAAEQNSEEDAAAAQILGDLAYEMTGRWKVVEGLVTHQDVKMESLSDNAFARLMANVVNGASRDLGGTANIMELEANRIVMLGDAGIAMRYDRVQ